MPPKIINSNRVFPYKPIHFGGFGTPIFGSTPLNGRQLYGALHLRNLESPGLALELPAEWVEGILAAKRPAENASA